MVERQSTDLDRVFHALADPSRRAILRQLSGGPRTVGELADPLPMSLAAASKHIKVLEQSGLLNKQVHWRTHLCSLNPAPLAAARTWIDEYEAFWDERFDALTGWFKKRDKDEPEKDQKK
jgi:DNA-binding transcriptional ArsR family regulator